MEGKSVLCLFGMEKKVWKDRMEFSLSGASSPGSDWRSGDGLDTRVKNRGTAGGGI